MANEIEGRRGAELADGALMDRDALVAGQTGIIEAAVRGGLHVKLFGKGLARRMGPTSDRVCVDAG